MTYAVSAIASTQTVPTVADAVSISQSSTGLCGGFTYTISSTLAIATTALTSTELSISSAGLISVSTNNVATIGTHTVHVTATLAQYLAIFSPTSFVLTI
jgi:hypothetical protein